MTRAFLGLGSNLGDRQGYLAAAVAALGSQVRAVSAVYETDPVGGPEQDAYLNAVVELDTTATPLELLATCRQLESAAGRVRVERWGPRTLDVDILWMDGVQVFTPELEIPHPRMFERRFVMAPLRELAPDLVSPEAMDQAAGEVRRLGPITPPT